LPSFVYTEGVGKHVPTNINRMFQSPAFKQSSKLLHVLRISVFDIEIKLLL